MAQTNNSYNRSRRKKKRKKKYGRVILARVIFMLSVLAVIALVAAGIYKLYGLVTDNIKKEAKVTTVTIARNGTISETIIEEFNPGFYDEESLRSDIDSRISASGGGVELLGLSFSGGEATLDLKYGSDDDMAAFNDEIFYADAIDDLMSQGVSFDSDAVKAGGSHAVIVSEPMDIRCPKKILYAGGQVTIDMDDQKLAHCTTEDGTIAFVIY